jgi:hypothetical protein
LSKEILVLFDIYIMNRLLALLLGLLAVFGTTSVHAFVTPNLLASTSRPRLEPRQPSFHAAIPDLDTIALVAGQENYGLAIVCAGEAVWSFLQAPGDIGHAAKTLLPAGLAALALVLLAGPMITSGDLSSVGTGLWISSFVSVALGLSYVLRLLSPYSASPKEAAGLGLLFAIAGFFSFAQNLLVDGFVALPSLPSIALPEINLDL